MAGKAKPKRKALSVEDGVSYLSHGPGTAYWLGRWQAAIPHMVAKYRRAVLEHSREMVEKYEQSLSRRLINKLKRRASHRGA